jgi:hypothetical protein
MLLRRRRGYWEYLSILCCPIFERISGFVRVYFRQKQHVRSIWSIVGMILDYSEQITVPGPLCRPQISHEVHLDRTRASTGRGRRLTAWAMWRIGSTPHAFVIPHRLRLRFGNTSARIDRVTMKEIDNFNAIKTVSVVDTCLYLSCDKRLTHGIFVTSSYKHVLQNHVSILAKSLTLSLPN